MPPRTRIALLAGVFAIAIGGCGSGDNGTIPPQNSEELLNVLTQIETLVETGDCTLAAGRVTELTDAINQLPDDVDPEVQSALTKGASNLLALTKDPDNCTGEGATDEGGVEPLESTSTSTTTTATSTTTVPEDTSTTEETQEEPPADQPTQDNETPPAGDTGDNGNQGDQGDQGGGTGGPSGGVDVPGGKR